MDNTLNSFILTCVILIFLFILINGDSSMDNCQIIMLVVLLIIVYFVFFMNVEGFTNYNGSLNNYRYTTTCKNNLKEPCDTPLNDTMGFTTFGSSVPLVPRETPVSNEFKQYSSVDGVSDKNSMFMFSYNQASPDCCPSSYSTSTGCVCTNQNQRDYITSRGNNNTSYSSSF